MYRLRKLMAFGQLWMAIELEEFFCVCSFGAFVSRAVLLISNCILENMSMVLPSLSWQAVFSLVPRPTLAPSQNGLAYKVEFLGFIGGVI